MSDDDGDDDDDGGGRLQCPFCGAYEVDRMYLASVRLDSCECQSCSARWDEEVSTGTYRGRATRTSTVTPRSS
ncbi:MAG: hypothetical protein U5R31_04440 [Acidimicrobiia bacterium]|nr:hypothetical protein [Acidimicrobiia bacterium]